MYNDKYLMKSMKIIVKYYHITIKQGLQTNILKRMKRDTDL